MLPTYFFLEVMSESGSTQLLLCLTSVFRVHLAQRQLSRALQARSPAQGTYKPTFGEVVLFKTISASQFECFHSSWLIFKQTR